MRRIEQNLRDTGLADRAEAIYEAHREDLWTDRDTLVELLMVAYREGWNVELVVANAKALVTVVGDTDSVLAAASHVRENGFTPFDALHLVHSGDDPIVEGDSDYDGVSSRLRLEPRPGDEE